MVSMQECVVMMALVFNIKFITVGKHEGTGGTAEFGNNVMSLVPSAIEVNKRHD